MPAIIVATETATESGGAQSPAETTTPSPTSGERRTAGQVILDQLASLRVGVGAAHAGMTVFPVFASSAAAPALRYRTLEQAIADGAVEVVEQASATVPELTLRNKGAVMIFVLDGEEVIGGRQNRIVNASFLIAENSTVTLPVTCVEHGRWHDVSPRFSSGESMPHAMRLAKHQQVSANLRALRVPSPIRARPGTPSPRSRPQLAHARPLARCTISTARSRKSSPPGSTPFPMSQAR